MGTRYLVSCSCGKHIPVEKQQAGETLRCECGATVDVPSLLALTRLPPADDPDSSQPSARPWGLAQQMTLIGALVLGFGLVWVGYLWMQSPDPPVVDPGAAQVDHETAAAMTPAESWRLWAALQSPLPEITPRAEAEYLKRVADHRRWMVLGAAIALIGGATMITAPFLKNSLPM